jgi:NADH-quinone oxidoreductase subunit E
VLTPEERAEIEEEGKSYPTRRALCIEAMKIVQKHRGWVPDEALKDLATLLGMTPDELDSVATFYNLVFRRPVGRHVVLLCDSVSCWIMGYGRLRDRLCTSLGVSLGSTTPDGRFTLLPVVCLGACDRAPAMMVDDDLHGDLDPEVDPGRISGVLERYR